MYRYEYNCVNPQSPRELFYIIENMEEISVNTFLRYIPWVQLKNQLCIQQTLKFFKNDYAVSFYKLKTKKLDVLVMVHSAIEFIFKKG